MSQIKSDSFLDDSSLQYNLLPGKYLGHAKLQLYENLYNFWHGQWSHAFGQINLPFSSTSEEFCRHEEVTCLTMGGQVTSCVLLDYFNIDSNVQKKHQYFSSYPKEVLQKITELAQGAPVFTISYLAVAPEFRKNYAFADLLMGLALHRVLESHSKVMISYTRNTRRTNDLTYRVGAKALAKDLIIRNEPSDFVYFDESSFAHLKAHPLFFKMESLWKNKIYFPSLNILPNNNKGRSYDKNELEHGF